jgi:hypothetical protein
VIATPREEEVEGRAPHACEDGRLDSSRERMPDSVVVRATRLQERRSRRAVAALSAALLLVIGLLGARHEAEVAHVRDGKGNFVHAQKLADHHEAGPAAHLHSRAEHRHAGDCELLAFLHAPAVSATPVAAIAAPALADELGAPPIATVHRAIAGYRLAPKTSPPALG